MTVQSKIFKVLCFCIISFNNCFAQVDASFYVRQNDLDIKVGKNIPIASKFNNLPVVEPHISAHPFDNDKLLVAAMVVTDINNPYESCRLSSFYSNDEGLKWTETTHDYWGYDPWTAILSNDTTCMTWLGTPDRFTGRFPLNFFTSSNNGKEWNNKVQVKRGLGHGHDGTKLVGLNNSFYATTVRFNNDMSADVILFESLYNGDFKEVAIIKGNGKRLNFCEPVILTNGNVVIPTMHYAGNIWAHIYNPKTKQLSKRYQVSKNPKLGRGYARMASDSNPSSKYKDRIYFVRAIAKERSSTGVWLNYSKDGGITWIEDKRIDLFKNGLLSKANVSSIAVNNNGIIGVSWVDGQHSEDQKSYDVYFSASNDGGVSFSEPKRITDVSSNPRTSGNADVANKFQGGGHYLGITSKADGSFQLVWSDSRSGVFQLQTCKVIVEPSIE